MCFSWFDVVFMRVCFNSRENQMEIIYTFKAVFVKTHFHHLRQQKSIKTIIKKTSQPPDVSLQHFISDRNFWKKQKNNLESIIPQLT